MASRRTLSAIAASVVCTVAALATLPLPAVWREPANTGGSAAFAGAGVARLHQPQQSLPEIQQQQLRPPPLVSTFPKARAPPVRGHMPAPPRRGARFLATASRLGNAAATAAGVVAAAAFAALPRRRNRDGQNRRRLQGFSGGIVAALPAGFKAFSESNVALMLRLSTLNFCKIYMAMLVLRITIMWFPNINPYRQPFYSMIQLTDPYLNLFRGWMPPIFGIDLSVILAFVVIQAVIDTLTVSPF